MRTQDTLNHSVMKSNFGKNFSKKYMYKPGRLVSLVLLTQ